METGIIVGANPLGQPTRLNLRMANRHGLIAGATGTGKTATLQILAEGFARNGVPVFMADVKGDLSGLSQPGNPNPKITERIQKIGLTTYSPRAYPSIFWDVFGKKGHPLRTTMSEMGPLLLSRLLNLNETQAGVLQMGFKIADDEGLLLLDTKDLKSLLTWMAEHEDEIKKEYGNVAPTTVGAIQRQLLVLSEAGGEIFFGEPAIRLEHLMQKDFSGNGVISILDATTLMQDARVYTSFLLWLLSELFEQLPEVGDMEKPKMVFFFDEAHLLFNDVPKVLLEKIEQVVKLIRSKGVGIYFVTQNPMDIPESVLAQLSNRFQHALRAYTPGEQKAVKVAAESFRTNPSLNTEQVITELGVGEALVSVLDEKGVPTLVERVLICPPQSRMGALTEAERVERINSSPLKSVYDQAVDRESAFEMLKKREAEMAEKAATDSNVVSQTQARSAPSPVPKGPGRTREGMGEAMLKSMVRAAGSAVGRKVIRGVLGSIFGGR